MAPGDLTLLASAIAGRSVALAEDEVAWTDGTTIYVPPDAPPASIAVQASLIAAGSLDGEVLRSLGRNRARARRYLAVEGHRALAANEAVLPRYARRLIDRSVTSDSPAASLALADQLVLEPPAAFGELRPRDVDDDGVDVSVLSALSVGRGGPLGRLLARLLRSGAGTSGSGALGDGAVHAAGAAAPDTVPLYVSATPRREEAAAANQAGVRYPEWDASRNAYRADWTTVIESDAAEVATAAAVRHAPAFTRALARVEVGLTPVRRRAQGDDVDIDAAVEAYVDEQAGAASGHEVYLETLRRRRDLSVVVLLDVSGSANEASVDGRRVHDLQVELAAAVTTTLHGLGDRVALYGFNSRGRTAVQMTRVKSFDAPLDAQALARLAALRPAAYTRLGAAIRHATAVARHQSGTPRRLLVVISDGFAYDHGYEGTYGEADARRALAEAANGGVGCVCLSVGAPTDTEDLQRVFGTAAHAQVRRVEDAPEVIGPLFRSAMRRIR
jgi:hypothetical protein